LGTKFFSIQKKKKIERSYWLGDHKDVTEFISLLLKEETLKKITYCSGVAALHFDAGGALGDGLNLAPTQRWDGF
jgi:hypothetical protein